MGEALPLFKVFILNLFTEGAMVMNVVGFSNFRDEPSLWSLDSLVPALMPFWSSSTIGVLSRPRRRASFFNLTSLTLLNRSNQVKLIAPILWENIQPKSRKIPNAHSLFTGERRCQRYVPRDAEQPSVRWSALLETAITFYFEKNALEIWIFASKNWWAHWHTHPLPSWRRSAIKGDLRGESKKELLDSCISHRMKESRPASTILTWLFSPEL